MEQRILKKLQTTELDILKQIDLICKKNNIEYSIMYGTLLGAVRHKGFIPWDDDIDICMLRKDYDRFIKIANSELNEKYKLDCIMTNKNHYASFAKVRNKKTIFDESSLSNYQSNKGIFVDIFPFDYIKKNKITKWYKFKFKIICVFQAIMIYRSLHSETSGKIKFLSKFMNNTLANKLITLLSNGSEKYNYLTFYDLESLGNGFIVNKDDVFPSKKIEFEKNMFSGPNNSHNVLIKKYGNDYMELPPIEKRTTHSPKYIKFEDGEEVRFDNI